MRTVVPPGRPASATRRAPYVLATGAAAVRGLHVLHEIYSPVGRRALIEAGFRTGMRVADFGCGVGAGTRMLADMAGPTGSVTGIDRDPRQLAEARAWCENGGVENVSFVQAGATRTGLPRGSFDLVYCRCLLSHVTDPMGCLREMRDLLQPDGIIVVEEGDFASAASIPATAMNAFAELFCRLGQARGLDYSLARALYHHVIRTGFAHVNVRIHQPAITYGKHRFFLKWSVEEAAARFIDAGIITGERLQRTIGEMHDAAIDPSVLVLAPQMFIVWGRKSEG